MTPKNDPRIPVRIGSLRNAGPGEALLVQGGRGTPADIPLVRFELTPTAPAHPLGCPCCRSSGPVAAALARLFLGRMRGELVPFDRVLVVPATPAGAQAVQAALTDD